ncbi:hypothetical protein A2U01_0032850, partial [Trifolium medium]|nr:hypothetical protein [Trifolium medium]
TPRGVSSLWRRKRSNPLEEKRSHNKLVTTTTTVVVPIEPKLKLERNETDEPEQPLFQIWTEEVQRKKVTHLTTMEERLHGEKNDSLDEKGGATRVTQEKGQSKRELLVLELVPY